MFKDNRADDSSDSAACALTAEKLGCSRFANGDSRRGATRHRPDAGDPVVVDRMDKLDRWHAARRNGLNAEVAASVFLDPLHLSVQDRIEG